MEDIKIIELPEKPSIGSSNYIITEDEDGTKKVLVKHFKSVLVSSLYFDSVEDLKNSESSVLKDGDIVRTLGYYTPGDGGGAMYKITYNPARVEDNGLVHYLNYSNTLRAEMILGDTVNVHQFGAVGDGKTDDTKAIQSAIDSTVHKVIEFNNNKTYHITRPIVINKSNTIINGNGAVLYPHYCDGITIVPSDINDKNDIPSDITINKLHINCKDFSPNGIFIHRSRKIDIMSCILSDITIYGITVKNSEFVNINFCKLSGFNSGSLIVIDGINSDNEPIEYSKFVNILDCDFDNFTKAINILSTGTGSDRDVHPSLNIDKCNYHSIVIGSRCIHTSTPVEMIAIHANTISQADTFLYFGGAGSGDITCRDISCTNVNNVFNIESENSTLYLDGSIKVPSSAIVFANMNGKLHSNISWDLLPNGACFVTDPTPNPPKGRIYDSIHPYNYSEGRGYTVSNDGVLYINEARNLNIDWAGGINRDLFEIRNGVNGQLLYIKSSVDLNIRNTVGELSDDIIKLGKYRGVLLKNDGNKWVQIQYKDSTILQTVRNEIGNSSSGNIMVDYDRIKFEENEIANLIP